MPNKNMPDNQESEDKKVRVGVYTCHCGGNISHVVQCERVAKTIGKIKGCGRFKDRSILLFQLWAGDYRKRHQGVGRQSCSDRRLCSFLA